jgi:hypothetical protein
MHGKTVLIEFIAPCTIVGGYRMAGDIALVSRETARELFRDARAVAYTRPFRPTSRKRRRQ